MRVNGNMFITVRGDVNLGSLLWKGNITVFFINKNLTSFDLEMCTKVKMFILALCEIV